MRVTVFETSRRRAKRLRRARCTLNGVDVTRRCQIADDREGWAVLWVPNEQGRPYFDKARGCVARERVHGRVRITFVDKAAA